MNIPPPFPPTLCRIPILFLLLLSATPAHSLPTTATTAAASPALLHNDAILHATKRTHHHHALLHRPRGGCAPAPPAPLNSPSRVNSQASLCKDEGGIPLPPHLNACPDDVQILPPAHPPPTDMRRARPRASAGAWVLLILMASGACVGVFHLAIVLHVLERDPRDGHLHVLKGLGGRVASVPAWFALYFVIDSITEASVRRLAHSNVDTTLLMFVRRLVKYGALAVALVGLLGVMGVKTTGFQGVAASVLLSIGFASKDLLSNIVAGIMILVYRPFTIGDLVILSGKRGIVHDISLFDTRLDTTSNVRIRIPNHEIFGKIIENWTRHPMIRVEVAVTTSASKATAQQARKALEEAIAPYADIVKKHQQSIAQGKASLSGGNDKSREGSKGGGLQEVWHKGLFDQLDHGGKGVVTAVDIFRAVFRGRDLPMVGLGVGALAAT